MQEFSVTSPVDRAYQKLGAGQRSEAVRIIERLLLERATATRAAVTWDAIFSESWTLLQAGDTLAARAHLLSALTNIGGMNHYTVEQPAQAAGLRRGLLLLRQIGVGSAASNAEQQWMQRIKDMSIDSPSRKRK
jgi:hypothetical protein